MGLVRRRRAMDGGRAASRSVRRRGAAARIWRGCSNRVGLTVMVALAVAALAVGPTAIAAGFSLPRLDGEVSGKIEALALKGAPELEWTLTVRSASETERAADLTARGPGTKASAELRLDAGGEGSWRVTDAEADLAAWARAVAGMLGEDFGDLILSGMVRLSGQGTWREHTLDGSVYLSVTAGRVELPSHQLVLEGLALEFVLEDLGALRSAPAQMISWTKGRYDTLELGPGRLMFTLAGDLVQIDEGVIDVLGGQVSMAAFTFSLKKPEMAFITRAVGLDLPALLPFLPDFFATIAGEVDGTLMLRWSPAGLEIGAGALSLRSEQDAELRLLPMPGLISDRVPAAILERVPNLRKIETGEATLKAKRFDVSFTPEGDQEGRSAVVRVAAEPMDPTYRAPIDLTVNFRGPIGSLVKFGTNSRIRLGGKP